jgi:hypothetical protein
MNPEAAPECREVAEMDCTQVERLVLSGDPVNSPEIERHLAECPACRELASDGGTLARLLASAEAQPTDPAPAPSYAAVQSLLAKERGFPAHLASLRSSSRWLVACLGLLIPCAIALTRLRPDLATFPVVRLATETAALFGVALVACWVWLQPTYRVQVRAAWLFALLGVALLLPWALAAWPLLGGLPSTLPVAIAGRPLPRAPGCFFYGSALALPVVVVLGFLGRRGRAVPGFVLLPAAAGALAGLVGLELHCPNSSPSHLLAGHAPIALALPVLLQALVMAARRRRALADQHAQHDQGRPLR